MITKTKKAVKSANVEQEPVAAVKDVSLSPIIAERIEHFFKNHNTTTPSESSASYIKFANKSEYELVGCCGPVSYASDIPLVVGYKINRKHLTPFLNNVEVLKEYISILNKYLLTKENDFDIKI